LRALISAAFLPTQERKTVIIKNNPQAAFLAAHRELKDRIGEQ
jgi:hypothetical protein